MAVENLHSLEAEFLKTLAHPVRITILEFLKEGEQAVIRIALAIKETQSSISRHLMALKRIGVLASRKRGKSTLYRIRDKRVLELLQLGKQILKIRLKEEGELLK